MANVWRDGSATPILPVASIERAAQFYRAIGFDVEAYDSGYAFIRAGGISIDIAQTDGFDPFVMAGMAYVTVGDPDATRAAILAGIALPGYHELDEAALRARWAAGHSLARITPVEDKPWGMREFALADVDNNLVRVGASIRRPSRGPTAGL
jgi:predicted lactoylglutathione lyase